MKYLANHASSVIELHVKKYAGLLNASLLNGLSVCWLGKVQFVEFTISRDLEEFNFLSWKFRRQGPEVAHSCDYAFGNYNYDVSI